MHCDTGGQWHSQPATKGKIVLHIMGRIRHVHVASTEHLRITHHINLLHHKGPEALHAWAWQFEALRSKLCGMVAAAHMAGTLV